MQRRNVGFRFRDGRVDRGNRHSARERRADKTYRLSATRRLHRAPSPRERSSTVDSNASSPQMLGSTEIYFPPTWRPWRISRRTGTVLHTNPTSVRAPSGELGHRVSLSDFGMSRPMRGTAQGQVQAGRQLQHRRSSKRSSKQSNKFNDSSGSANRLTRGRLVSDATIVSLRHRLGSHLPRIETSTTCTRLGQGAFSK